MTHPLLGGVNGMRFHTFHANRGPEYLSLPGASSYIGGVWNSLDSYQAMIGHAKLQPGESVLDVACGPGCLGLLACEQLGSARNVWFTDYSRPLLNEAEREVQRRYGNSAQDHFVLGDIREDSTINALLAAKPRGFDVLLVNLILNHFTEASRPMFLRHIKRLLAPSGRLIVQSEVASPSGRPHDAMIVGIREVERTEGWGEVRRWSMNTRLAISSFTTFVTTMDRNRGRDALRQLLTESGFIAGNCIEGYDRSGSTNISGQITAAASDESAKPKGAAPRVKQDYARNEVFNKMAEEGRSQSGHPRYSLALSLIIEAKV